MRLKSTLLSFVFLGAPFLAHAKTAEEIILEIAPESASCNGAPAAGECLTAKEAADPAITAFNKYKIHNPSAIAACLSLILFESGNLKYAKNHFPGRPGQGTRNMQMFEFNVEYAKSIPAIASQLDGLIGTGGTPTDAQKDGLVAKLNENREISIGSGPWFMATKCGEALKMFAAGSVEPAFEAYMACVGVGADGARREYWTRAKEAFGVS